MPYIKDSDMKLMIKLVDISIGMISEQQPKVPLTELQKILEGYRKNE